MQQKIKNIEFLKILFIIMIVYAHIMWLCCSVFKLYNNFSLYKKLYAISTTSFVCVEYFFIMSGFLFFFHIQKNNDNTLTYSFERFIRLWPLLFCSICILYLLSLFGFCEFYPYSNILNLLFLFRTGIDNGPVNNIHSWFVCILFWCSIFYHYIYRNFNQKAVNLIVVLIVFYSYTAILSYYSGIIPGVHTKLINGISGGILRGLASIGLGFLIGLFWHNFGDYIKNFEIKNKFKSFFFSITVSFFEIYLFLFIFNNSIFHKIKYRNQFIFVVAFIALFILFLAKKGILSKLLENNLSVFLGKFSYSIYIMQAVGFVIAKHYFWLNKSFVYTHPYLNIVITILICIIIGILSRLFIEVKTTKYLKDRLNNLNIEKSPTPE